MGQPALDLIERHGPAILRTARRYSQTAEDAEDAYQRALEILLTKAPSADEDDLVPWLRTVVKHEAFALRRAREQLGTGRDEALDGISAPVTTAEQAEHKQRLMLGAEALAKLKPQEVECLLLLADGFSYREVADRRGWTYTDPGDNETIEGPRPIVIDNPDSGGGGGGGGSSDSGGVARAAIATGAVAAAPEVAVAAALVAGGRAVAMSGAAAPRSCLRPRSRA